MPARPRPPVPCVPATGALVLAAAAALGAPSAQAAAPLHSTFVPDNEQKLQWHCTDVSVVQGTVPWAVAVEARRSHARTYSALAELETGLLPALAERKKGAVLRIGWNSLFNVTQLPSIACGELASQVYDVGAYNMSWGIRSKRFAVYYSAAATYALVSEDWSHRTIKHGGGFMLGHFYSFTAPLWGARVINANDIGGSALTDDWAFMSSGDGAIGGVSLDYIAGASADLDVAVFGLGYVGSQGLFVNARQPQTGLFFDTVGDLRALGGDGELGLLRYLKTGISAFRWFLDKRDDLHKTVGATDLSFARYRVVTPTGRVLRAQDVHQDADIQQDQLSLTQLQQRNLWEILDLSARYQLAPTPQLYELGARIHTRGYHADLLPGRIGRKSVPDQGAASAAIGLVNLPRRTYFGVPGGPRPFLVVDYVYYLGQGRVNSSNVRASLKRNDPDTLIIFPYAQNATETHITFEIAF